MDIIKPQHPKHKLIIKDWFEELPIQQLLADSEERYLAQTLNTLNKAVMHYPRTYALRVDLRLPSLFVPQHKRHRDEVYEVPVSERLMKRFIESLRAQIEALDRRRQRLGKRKYSCRIRYVWCRERHRSLVDHFHLVLFFNKDRFNTLGNHQNQYSVLSLIQRAWARALGEQEQEVKTLVHFPDNHSYWIKDGKPGWEQDYSVLFNRLSYFAKKRTKPRGEGKRCFGCSR
ncbi:inovirus Gp2 family protein [Parashewanella spongiae]|uniref:Inovirus Gp2 family protein n=1 Tax=Parashewanella spongiae TaxID=342950 RepID=A0A3A6TZY4_9GAMM|nr:inovirus Gp2 family protein [Parashewanella spongiae]MCL1077052.1 inovirus Gp2 family protein [Parashewanella spongiae]RJY18734.1 inovirus Gp2 family protein [Parashewanella spongiae]